MDFFKNEIKQQLIYFDLQKLNQAITQEITLDNSSRLFKWFIQAVSEQKNVNEENLFQIVLCIYKFHVFSLHHLKDYILFNESQMFMRILMHYLQIKNDMISKVLIKILFLEKKQSVYVIRISDADNINTLQAAKHICELFEQEGVSIDTGKYFEEQITRFGAEIAGAEPNTDLNNIIKSQPAEIILQILQKITQSLKMELTFNNLITLDANPQFKNLRDIFSCNLSQLAPAPKINEVLHQFLKNGKLEEAIFTAREYHQLLNITQAQFDSQQRINFNSDGLDNEIIVFSVLAEKNQLYDSYLSSLKRISDSDNLLVQHSFQPGRLITKEQLKQFLRIEANDCDLLTSSALIKLTIPFQVEIIKVNLQLLVLLSLHMNNDEQLKSQVIESKLISKLEFDACIKTINEIQLLDVETFSVIQNNFDEVIKMNDKFLKQHAFEENEISLKCKLCSYVKKNKAVSTQQIINDYGKKALECLVEDGVVEVENQWVKMAE
ncbi:Hypothetical_protein [Hexamita inflata]|uniref:Hypothetical_protein n=1 Tax=Hexamita inflata TaxID=28002 RepID=A0ABP1J9V4_9EUKA